MTVGLVFNIQPFSVHDGPGIRTMVFLKGCPLKCRWCSNPESQAAFPEPALNVNRCLGLKKCRLCLGACRAIKEGPEDLPVLDRQDCHSCQDHICRELCPSGALIVYGRSMEALEVFKAVKKDAVFHTRSAGGMTLTGGEPLYQPDFALELLGLAKKAHIHTAMETSGQAPYQVLRQAALHLNALLYDLKTLDPAKHLSFTGVEQSRILENLLKLYQDFPDLPITVRTPVVPSFNQDSTSACEIGRFLRKLPRVCFEALPYHSLGQQKYGYLGRPYTLDSQGLSENDLLQFSQLVNQARFSESTVQSSLA